MSTMDKNCDTDQRAESFSYNCSSIIIGKNASTTGKVILAHNEDDNGVVNQQHIVPRVKHAPDETIVFEDGTAVIPQVSETYEYYWSEMRSSKEKISAADGFVNEWGVAVYSDSCISSKEEASDPQPAEMLYALRRLVAERSKTAREGVEVAVGLIEKYGYNGARSYQICDKDEAWVLQVAKGKHYAAKRVPDDEVLYIPNWYIIHEIDFADTEHKNYYFASDLVSYAIKHGWYTPAKGGDYSDFDFAKAYQGAGENQFNILRARNAWKLLMGREPDDIKQFSVKLDKKIGAPEAKKVLRSHYEGTPDDLTCGYDLNPHMSPNRHFTICNTWTIESSIIEFNENPALTRIWRASLTPCISPYVPWYLGMTEIPAGYNWCEPLEAQKTHFCPPAQDDQYHADRAFWTFMTLKYLTDFDYKGTHATIQASIRELESNWLEEQANVEAEYHVKLKKDPALATEFITEYTAAQAAKAQGWAHDIIQRLGEAKVRSNEGYPAK